MSSQYWEGAPESGLDCGGPAAPGWRRLGIKAKELRAYMAGFDPANWPAASIMSKQKRNDGNRVLN